MLALTGFAFGIEDGQPAFGGIIFATAQGSFIDPAGSAPPFFWSHEPIASYPGYPTADEYRGFMEFDLDSVPDSGFTATLNLSDSGGTNVGLATTDVSYYVGDGAISLADFDPTGRLFAFQITRPFRGPTTTHDVTSIVRDFKAANYKYLGFFFQASARGQDAFYFDSSLAIDAAAVPEPATGMLLAIGAFGAWPFRKRFRSAPTASC